MNPDDEQLPADAFTPLGAVSLTTEAVDLAKRALHTISNSNPNEDWVVCVLWTEGRTTGSPESNEWIDHGPGLAVGVYERRRVPATARLTARRKPDQVASGAASGTHPQVPTARPS